MRIHESVITSVLRCILVQFIFTTFVLVFTWPFGNWAINDYQVNIVDQTDLKDSPIVSEKRHGWAFHDRSAKSSPSFIHDSTGDTTCPCLDIFLMRVEPINVVKVGENRFTAFYGKHRSLISIDKKSIAVIDNK